MNASLKTIIPGVFAFTAICITAFFVLSSSGSFGSISDLPEYYAPARLVLAGRGADAYDLLKLGKAEQTLFPSMKDRVVGLFVPPPGLAWIAPLGWLPVRIVPIFWKLLLAAGLATSIFIIARMFNLSRPGVMWLIALSSISGPVFESLRIDQLAPLLVAAFCGALWALRAERPLIAGLCLSVLALKPPQILPFLVFLLGARRYKVLLIVAGMAVVLSVLSLVEIGPQGVSNYLHLMRSSIESSMYMQPELTPTVRGQLLRLIPQFKTIIMIVSALILVAAQGLTYCWGRKFAERKLWLEAALLTAMPLGLVTSLHCHEYDLLLLMPSLVVLMKDHFQDHLPPVSILIGIMAMLVFFVPFSIYIRFYYLLKGGIINPNFWILLVFALALQVFVYRNQQLFDRYKKAPNPDA